MLSQPLSALSRSIAQALKRKDKNQSLAVCLVFSRQREYTHFEKVFGSEIIECPGRLHASTPRGVFSFGVEMDSTARKHRLATLSQ